MPAATFQASSDYRSCGLILQLALTQIGKSIRTAQRAGGILIKVRELFEKLLITHRNRGSRAKLAIPQRCTLQQTL
jgi:hypothetical protein